MTLDDLRKKIVGGIHDATGAYNKIAAAVPLVPTTKTVSSTVSKVQKSLDGASRQVTKTVSSGVADVRNRIVSEAKALPSYKSNIARTLGDSALKTINPNLPTAIQSVKAVGQQLQPKLVRQYTSNLRQGMSNIADPNKAQQEIDRLGKIRGAGVLGQAAMYGANRYLAPIIQTPARFNQIRTGIQKRNVGDMAMGALGTLGGIAALSPDPLSDIGMPAADLAKGYLAGMREYGNKTGSKASFDPKAIAYALNRGRQAFTLEKPVGIGEAVTDNPTGQTVGNLLELPFVFATAHKLNKGTPLFDKKTIEEAKKYLGNEARDSIGRFAQKVEMSSNPNKTNMGDLGDEIQSIAEGIWGDKAANLTNKQLKNAFDLLLQQMDAGKGYDRSLAFGLSTKNVRELVGDAPVKSDRIEALKQEARKYRSAEEFEGAIKSRIKTALQKKIYDPIGSNKNVRSLAGGYGLTVDEQKAYAPKVGAKNLTDIWNQANKGATNVLSSSDRVIGGKAQFRTINPIETVKPEHTTYLDTVNRVKSSQINQPAIVGKIGEEVTKVPGLQKALVLSEEIVKKIKRDHGAFPSENFVITANNPSQAVILDNGNKINLIKRFGDDQYFVVGANKTNGYFTVTYFEPEAGDYVKRQMRKGEVVDFTGRASSPFATSPEGAASQLASPPKRFSGVSNTTGSIIPSQTTRSQESQSLHMLEMMTYGQIMRRAGYKAADIRGTSLQQFKESILPRLPGQLRAEFLNYAAEMPKMLEMEPKRVMGAAKALLDKGVIRQDEFDEFVRMYGNKASFNPGAKTPMKQVMRDKYAMDNQEAFDSLVNQKNNEELISRMNKQNRLQDQSARPGATTGSLASDRMGAGLGELTEGANSGKKAFDKTAPLKEQIQRARLELEYNREPSIPVYDTPTKNRLAGSAQQNIIDDKEAFMKYFSEWIGQRDAAKTRATKTVEKFTKIPKEHAWDIVKYIENPKIAVSETVKTYAKEVSDMYESLYKQASEENLPMNKLVGYVTHIWKETPEQVQQKMLGMGQKFRFAKEREIPTYEEGIAMGLTPKYTTPAEIMQEYVRRLEQVKSNIDFFTKLKRKGFVVDASVGAGNPYFEPITGQGFPPSISSVDDHIITGNYYAPKEVAQIINRVFNPQEANALLQKTAKVSSTMQDILMSGGIPKTPVNAWSLAQLQKELMAGSVTRPLASFVRSFFGRASNKFFSDNANQIIKMQERNIPISSTYDASNMVDKSFLNKTFGNGWGEVWHKVTSEPTFKRFMPQLQISLFNDVERGLLRAGKSPKEAADIAAEAVRNFYAVRGTDAAALANPNTEALKTTFLFAPSYRETMIKFWLNNIKSVLPVHVLREPTGWKLKLNNPLSAQNVNNTRFVVGSLLTLAAYNKLNEYFNDGKNMLQNPRGREDQLLIPVSKITGNEKEKTVLAIPWLSSIAYMPRTALKIAKSTAEGDLKQTPRQAKGFLSTMLRPVADVVTNEDYFQNEIYNETDKPSEKWQKTGDYLFKQYGLQHPYMKTGYEAIQGKISSPFELAAKATELPIRFTTKDKLNSQYYYQNRDDVLRGLSEEERKAFLSLPKKSGQESESESSAETRIKYNTYVRYPAVLEAQKQIAIKQANGDMSKVDPLYALDSEQLKYFAAYTAASPGSYERRNILAEAPWIKEFQGIRSAFFDKVSRDKIAEDLKNGTITEDEAKQKIQALDENLAKYSGSSSSGSKKIKVRKVADIKKSKGTTSKGRTIKLKKIARSMATRASVSGKVPTIKLKKKRTNTTATNMAKKFRVVIRKSVS